jgi:hypothetical protein
LAGPDTGNDGAFAALAARCLEDTLILQSLEMIAHRSGGTQTNCSADLPNGGRIAMLGNELIHIFHDLVGCVAGSGHEDPSIFLTLLIL